MTHFQDDSHILSKLGILDSNEESPKKVKSAGDGITDKFVEVNMDEELSDSDAEDTIFDKDHLLNSNASHRSVRPWSESSACRCILVLATYFAMGTNHNFLMSGHEVIPENLNPLIIIPVLSLLMGLFFGRCLQYRTSSCLICLGSLVGLLISNISTGSQTLFITYTAVQNALIGVLLFVGLTLWFSLWRSQPRVLLIIYSLFALGCFTSVSVQNLPLSVPTSINATDLDPYRVPIRPVRALSDLDLNEINRVLNASHSVNFTTTFRPKKPEVAEGASSEKTKAAENEEKRKAHEELVNSNNSSSGDSPEKLPSPTSTTTTSLPTTSTHVEKPKEFPKNESLGNNGEVADRMIASSSTRILRLSLLSAVIFLYTLASCFCCVFCRISADSKITKLRDPSASGFTKGCRVRLCLFQVLIGVAQVFAMSTSSSNAVPLSQVLLAIFLSHTMAAVISSYAFSLLAIWILLLIGAASSFITVFSTFQTSIILANSVLSVLPLLLTLNIETRLQPRASMLIDLYLLPNGFGYFIGYSICVLLHSHVTTSLAFIFILLILLLPFLFRSISKAVRLKQVMDYTVDQSPSGMGAYMALAEEIPLSDEDDTIEMDDL